MSPEVSSTLKCSLINVSMTSVQDVKMCYKHMLTMLQTVSNRSKGFELVLSKVSKMSQHVSKTFQNQQRTRGMYPMILAIDKQGRILQKPENDPKSRSITGTHRVSCCRRAMAKNVKQHMKSQELKTHPEDLRTNS